MISIDLKKYFLRAISSSEKYSPQLWALCRYILFKNIDVSLADISMIGESCYLLQQNDAVLVFRDADEVCQIVFDSGEKLSNHRGWYTVGQIPLTTLEEITASPSNYFVNVSNNEEIVVREINKKELMKILQNTVFK